MPKSTGEEWFSVLGASEYLGIVTRTLDRLIDEGQLPAYKFGRAIRLRQSEVIEFLESTRIEPGSLGHLRNKPASSGPSPSSQARLSSVLL